jgi:tRNA(adenine34) deaminase
MNRTVVHDSFMQLALEQARQALARGEFPVGCVLVQGDQAVVGAARQGSRALRPNECDHAEMVALRRYYAFDGPLPPGPLTVYSTMEPCLMCFGALLLAGVHTIVYAYEDVMGGAASCDRSLLPPLYHERAVQIVGGVGRSESLSLFQAFFTDPANNYWRDSLLARYSLAQEPLGDESDGIYHGPQ